MERALADFIRSCAKVATAKHVSINRPITLRVQNPVNGDTQVIICAVEEPSVEFLPNNVIWLNCNPAANWYNHMLRLTSTLAHSGFDNTWSEIMSYEQVFSVAETPVVSPTGPTQNPTNPNGPINNPTDPSNPTNNGSKGDTGEKGDQGPPGERGEKGDTGPRGPEGLRGPAGDRGEKGDTGNIGERGEQGFNGERGERGEIGPRGFQGDRGFNGDHGEKGERGEKGDTGARGEIGPASDNQTPMSIDGGRVGKEHALYGQFFSVDAGRI